MSVDVLNARGGTRWATLAGDRGHSSGVSTVVLLDDMVPTWSCICRLDSNHNQGGMVAARSGCMEVNGGSRGR